MPIMRRLKTLDWPTLVAELVLIFVGITAALWFDSLNESRADRRLETDVLSELEVALESDTVDLNFNLRSSARTLTAIDTVLTYLDQRHPYESTLVRSLPAGVDPHRLSSQLRSVRILEVRWPEHHQQRQPSRRDHALLRV